MASGVYLYRLVTTDNVQTRKLTLLRSGEAKLQQGSERPSAPAGGRKAPVFNEYKRGLPPSGSQGVGGG